MRRLACASLTLFAFSGLARTARADGVRPDACWTEGDPCDNAMGSHPGICTRARCGRSVPNSCAGGTAGEAGQDHAGEGGASNSGGIRSNDGGCTGTHVEYYDCLRCELSTAGSGGGGGTGAVAGGAGVAGNTVAGEGGESGGGMSGTTATGGTTAMAGSTGGGGRAAGGTGGSGGGDSGCSCRIGAGSEERTLAGLMFCVGLSALGVSRRRSRRGPR